MLAQRVSRLWFGSVVAGFVLLGTAGTASAAPPTCPGENARTLDELPAGVTCTHPQAKCSDADGDPITIEITEPPEFGTFEPAGPLPINEIRRYTANADAAGSRDSMKWQAVSADGRSDEYQVDVWILPANSVPVCKDLALNVQAGTSVVIAPECVDADGDSMRLRVKKAPDHGTYDAVRETYTAAARYAGQDTMTFEVVDGWRQVSAEHKITITVASAPGGPRPQRQDRAAHAHRQVAAAITQGAPTRHRAPGDGERTGPCSNRGADRQHDFEEAGDRRARRVDRPRRQGQRDDAEAELTARCARICRTSSASGCVSSRGWSMRPGTSAPSGCGSRLAGDPRLARAAARGGQTARDDGVGAPRRGPDGPAEPHDGAPLEPVARVPDFDPAPRRTRERVSSRTRALPRSRRCAALGGPRGSGLHPPVRALPPHDAHEVLLLRELAGDLILIRTAFRLWAPPRRSAPRTSSPRCRRC